MTFVVDRKIITAPAVDIVQLRAVLNAPSSHFSRYLESKVTKKPRHSAHPTLKTSKKLRNYLLLLK